MSTMTSPVFPHDRKTRNGRRGGIASKMANSLLMAFGIVTALMLISRGTRSAAADTSAPGVATKTPSAEPGTPVISNIPAVVLVGGSFDVTGSGFTAGSVLNFFVATGSGPVNEGPLTPNLPTSPTLLTVKVPDSIPLGEGFVSVVVINTDEGFKSSNPAYALLQGSAGAGVPSITAIDGKGLAATSSNPKYATNNVETVVVQGSAVKLGGNGFDTDNGVAIDLFCACTGGKVGPFFLNTGNAGLSPTLLTFTLPAAGLPNSPATGPGSFVVSNRGDDGSYRKGATRFRCRSGLKSGSILWSKRGRRSRSTGLVFRR
jgi:hypothetical protein